ncbi:MAG: CRISPR-associated endonuclease Cas2 [Candidatus Saccharibacteria bacterium]|nr:CRISPR-associated endonuclease Cas2 [Candidatus Saccharibacteria bacterium]
MRVVIMFDLPTDTSMDRRHYRWFRKFLINEGFVMMQESIYTKICINVHAVDKVEQLIQKNKPPKGIVQLMVVTEKQFASMRYVVGEDESTTIQTDERMVVL